MSDFSKFFKKTKRKIERPFERMGRQIEAETERVFKRIGYEIARPFEKLGRSMKPKLPPVPGLAPIQAMPDTDLDFRAQNLRRLRRNAGRSGTRATGGSGLSDSFLNIRKTTLKTKFG